MKKVLFLLTVVCSVLFSSCGSTRHAKVFRPDSVRLEISMDDLEYLGQTEISVTYNTYLGLFDRIETVNGEVFDESDCKSANIDGFMGIMGVHMDLAAFKVLEQFPEASYFMPICQTTSSNHLFLGREVTCRATVRAYKFKERK